MPKHEPSAKRTKHEPHFYNYHTGNKEPLIVERHITLRPDLYRALAIKHALKLYATTKIRVNRAYTPRAMMKAASEITGETFKSRDYDRAWRKLHTWIERNKYNV